MKSLTAAELAHVRDCAESDSLSDTLHRAGIGIMTLRLLDDHAKLREALTEALSEWHGWEYSESSYPVDENPSIERIAELRKLTEDDRTP